MKIDWELIKTAYVTGDKSLAEIAGNFKVSEIQVKRHSSKDSWIEARKLWRSNTQRMAADKRSTEMVTEITQFDQNCLSASRKGIQLINEVLNAIIIQRPKDKDIKATIEWVEDRNDSIKELGKALNDYQKAGKVAMGDNPEQKTGTINNTINVSDKVINEAFGHLSNCGAIRLGDAKTN